MAHGFKSGGRQKGTKNKINRDILENIVESGDTPLEYMIRVMRDPACAIERRDAMAMAAAPYIHSKQAQLEINQETHVTVQAIRFLTEEEWLTRKERQTLTIAPDGSSSHSTHEQNGSQSASVIDELEKH